MTAVCTGTQFTVEQILAQAGIELGTARSVSRPALNTLSYRSSYILIKKFPGPGCSKLTTSLVNVSLKFQTLISEIRQYFLLKKCKKLLHCKSFSHFFNKKFQFIRL